MTATIDAGALNRRVLIQARSQTKDTVGQRDISWNNVARCWARIEQLQGRELETAQAINAEITHRVVIRYRSGITAAMRVVYQGRFLNIEAPLDIDTDHILLHLMCSEGLNRG